VDLTVIGIGRYIPRIVRIAQRTELNIVVATGLYTYNDLPIRFHHLGPGRDARRSGDHDGDVRGATSSTVSADTGVRAAILKCATDEPGVTPGVERVLRAGGTSSSTDRSTDIHAHPTRASPSRLGSAEDLRRGRALI